MADIQNQAQLNSHEIGTSLVYSVGGLTTEEANFNPTGAATIRAEDDSAIACTVFRSPPSATGLDLNLGNGGVVTITTPSSGSTQTTNAQGVVTRVGSFLAGTLRADGKSFVANHSAGSHQWPGFASPTASPYTMVIPRCTFTVGPQFIAANQASAGTATLVCHFQGMASTGNDFTGVSFENGQLITPFPAIPFVGVRFSPDSALDGARALQGITTQPSYRRLMQPREATAPNIRWGGDFACDFRNWTEDIPTAFQIRNLAAAVNAVNWYVIDGQFSNEWLTGANGIANGAGFRISARDVNLNNAGYVTTTVHLGRSFNPSFVDIVDNNTLVTDLQYNVGNFPVLELGTTSNPSTEPNRINASGGRNIIEAYPGGTRRTGIATLEQSQQLQPNDVRMPIPQAARNYQIWSYTHRSFENTGATSTIEAQAGTFTQQLVLSQDVAGIRQYAIANDPFTDGRTLAQSNADNTGSTGVTDFNRAYPMAKEMYHRNNLNTFILAPSTAINEINVGTNTFTFDRNSSSLSTSAFSWFISGNINLGGGSVTAGVINGDGATTTLSNGTLNVGTTLDTSLLAFGTGITIGGGNVTGVTANTFPNAVSFTGTPTLTFNTGTHDITSWDTAGIFDPAGTSVILEVRDSAQAVSFFGGAAGDYPAGQDTSFSGVTIRVPAAPPVVRTLRPAGNIDQIRGGGGYWRVVDSSFNVVQTHDITNATTLNDVSFTRNSDSSDVFTWYYLPSSAPGTSSFDYGTATWSGTLGDQFAVAIDDSSLTSGIDATSLTYTAANVSVSVRGGTSGTDQQLDIVVNATDTVNREQSQEIALVVRNDVDYIDTVVARRLTHTTRIVSFAQPFITVYNGEFPGGTDPVSGDANFQVVRLALNDSVTTPTGLTNTVGYVSVANGASPPVMFFDTTVVSLTAGTDTITAAVDASTRVQNIDRKTSYLVGGGRTRDGNNVVVGSRLNGIRPAASDYDSDTPYENQV